ncbi:MAG: hypothetical protein BroJett042_11820 [Bacteroidota bacterium]|nr:MAG: hypothetical protein BroJett042_11820 [Bacteroidota bacterium]
MNLRSSLLRRLVLPGIILQSVLIGGGYATGREIVEYGGKYGAAGWISGLAIFFGFSLIAFLSMEACRYWKVYDYKSLLKKLIGPGWIAYEIVYLLLAILIIAVMASAAGEILHQTLNFPKWIGVVLITLVVGFLNYKGEETIAKLETIGSIALFAAYFIFTYTVFSNKGDEIANVFSTWNTAYQAETPSLFLLLWTGILYVGYNLAVYPASFFTFRNLTSRKDSLIAAIVSGLLMTIPWFLTYLAVMAYYPDKGVLDSAVPWLKMLAPFSPILIIIFGIVVGWTLIETATGMIHAFISRIESEAEQKGTSLKKITKAWISLAALLSALLLAQVGIIDLVAKGYTFMAYAMIAVYAVPLLVLAGRFMKTRNT